MDTALLDFKFTRIRARLKVVICARNPPTDPGSGALQCGTGVSHRFRIVQ